MKHSDVPEDLTSEEWAPVAPAVVCLAILKSEWHKSSVTPITSWHDKGLIDDPDLMNATENTMRRLILDSWRARLLRGIPGDTQWYCVRFLRDVHLDRLLVIGSDDWLDSRDNNELRRVALRRPQNLRSPPSEWHQLVLWSHAKSGPFTIIEGNNRLTSYCSAPRSQLLHVECFVGLSSASCTWHVPDQIGERNSK